MEYMLYITLYSNLEVYSPYDATAAYSYYSVEKTQF
jgi:hypothetical protein